jgi:tRNA-2-methylthio-N6-dimethylallyladenosine synthase
MPNTPIVTDGNQDLGKGRGVYISTYGCQMNVNDTERMYSLLEMVNFVPVVTPEQASVIIINSCSVREKPVHKVHSEVGTYRNLKKKNADLRIGVSGCVAQQEKQNLVKNGSLIDFVVGTDAIDFLPQIISDSLQRPGGKVVSAKFDNENPYQIETLIRNPGVATFVNIMKGCDNFCSFCIVPFTRGRERSRALKEILADIQTLVGRGVQEVTLLGQNVNSYKSECSANFEELLKVLCEETDLKRIRYTSPHPKDFTQELIDLSQKYRSKICDYIHMPAQSGNTEVLARMNRGYTREEYLNKVAMIRAGIPGVALSTDLIVGFPGETQEQFEDTMSLIETVRYENVYSFAYSPRPFTKAARFEEQLDEAEKSRRLSALIDRQRVIAFELAEAYNGGTYEVLFEEFKSEDQKWVGRTTHNKLVYVTADATTQDQNLIGQIRSVHVTRAAPTVLYGNLVSGGVI